MATIQALQVEMPSKFSMRVSRAALGGTFIKLEDLEFKVDDLHMLLIEAQDNGTAIVRIVARDVDESALTVTVVKKDVGNGQNTDD